MATKTIWTIETARMVFSWRSRAAVVQDVHEDCFRVLSTVSFDFGASALEDTGQLVHPVAGPLTTFTLAYPANPV